MTQQDFDRLYMQRCFDLATKGGKAVRPNPMVGAVLVHSNRIIGEGWHQQFGGPHAEVNCINSVADRDRKYVDQASLYVSLEPCSFTGKTPACTNLILQHKIPRVVISALDPNPLVNGQGVRILRERGIEVITGVSGQKGNELIRTFHINQLQKRPYIILKIVKSKHNYIGKKGERIWLSNPYSALLSHRWRSEVDGILVGTETVINDDPELTNRLYPGNSPVRILADRNNRLNPRFRVLDGNQQTILFRKENLDQLIANTEQIVYDFSSPDALDTLLHMLFEKGIFVLLVEGGAKLISSFLKSGKWDEARIIKTPHPLSEGIKAPNLIGKTNSILNMAEDQYHQLFNPNLPFK